MSLSDVSIIVTSFLRPGCLFECLDGLDKNLPECPVIVVDDSGIDMPSAIQLPFDSGLSAKRNAGVAACETPFLLMIHDDQNLGSPEAREGVERLLFALERDPSIDVAAGRNNGVVYEGFLEYKPGEYIKETRLQCDGSSYRYKVDIAGNYFMARTERVVPWDNRMKITGEHGDWYLSMKEAGRCVVWVPGVNGPCQAPDPKKESPSYKQYRGRKDGHQIFKQKWNIPTYIDFDGRKS